jgi:protein TonB
MNIQRFGMPVIIAAALHGALFLVSAEPEEVVITAPTKPVPITFTPMQEEPIATPPEDSASDSDTAASGPANPLPMQPDVIPPLTPDHGITVPITPYRQAIDPVKDLRGVTGLPGGNEFGTGPVGRPSIPGVDKLDRVPRAVTQTSPTYPDLMRREGVDGTVTVEFVVGTDGRVVQAEAVKWSRREFVEPAVRAVWRWRFEPGTQNGRKVSFRMAVPIQFSAAQ